MYQDLSKTDRVFAQTKKVVAPFEFNDLVADCFDDMVSRSIPFYDEIHKIILDLLDYHYRPGELVVDLGCSTATTIHLMGEALKRKGVPARFLGVDSSRSMLKKAQEKIDHFKIDNVTLSCRDITQMELPQAQIIVMNYTLQFIPLQERRPLLKKIYDGLNPGGILIYSEKIVGRDSEVNQLLVDLYHDFKRRNGYSELEIAQKREALENVLIPLSPDEHLQFLTDAGFDSVDTIFRWYNFASFLGIKR